MTLAWYGHLKVKQAPLWIAITASWALAFFEYLFQVPANRIGSSRFTLMQLKVMQECITIVVFVAIACPSSGAVLLRGRCRTKKLQPSSPVPMRRSRDAPMRATLCRGGD